MDNRPGETSPSMGDSMDRARETTESAFDEAKQSVQAAVSTAQDAVKEQAGLLKDKAMGAVEDAQAKAADQSRTAASTLRETATHLDGELPWMKAALDKTADGFDHLTAALNKGDVSQALNAVTDFARRQPALFLGLSVAAGFALARVGKTVIEEAQPHDTPSPDGELLLKESVAPYAPSAGV